jgi:4-hydroxy-4-methyl-2-oxoglutarate aldolase
MPLRRHSLRQRLHVSVTAGERRHHRGVQVIEDKENDSMTKALPTPLIADAAMRCAVPMRFAPRGISLVSGDAPLGGRVRPAQHSGSVDVFIEAVHLAAPGDVLVIDNGGRLDEGCVGDLVTLEAKNAGLAGILIWGANRDSAELREVGLPVFSYGQWPCGPRRLDSRTGDALTRARFGDVVVTADDHVFADTDGVIFIPSSAYDPVISAAQEIHRRERAQADRIRAGTPLFDQFRFRDYLERRSSSSALTFREHLRTLGGEIEQ